MRHLFVSGLLLAAGRSSRFGRLKQVEDLDGVPLVERAVRTLRRSGVDEVVVVLGFEAGKVLRRLGDKALRVVLNPGFDSGLSSSLRMGVQSLDSRSEAVIVCLADQPFVTPALLDAIIRRFVHTRASAIASCSGTLVSPPMLLSSDLYEEVGRLTGDKGAKGLALSQPSFQKVEVDPDTLLDVDTERSLVRARSLLRERLHRSGDRPGKR